MGGIKKSGTILEFLNNMAVIIMLEQYFAIQLSDKMLVGVQVLNKLYIIICKKQYHTRATTFVSYILICNNFLWKAQQNNFYVENERKITLKLVMMSHVP